MVNQSASLVCCDISKIVFNQECTKIYDSEMDVSKLIYKCILVPNETSSSDQKFITQFDMHGPNSRKTFTNCIRNRKIADGSLENNKLFVQECKLRLISLTINTNETTEVSHLYTVSQQAPYITALNLQMHYKCHNVTSVVTQFKHLEKLTLNIMNTVNLNECEDFSFEGTQLTKLHVYLNKPTNLKSPKLKNYTFKPTFLRDMKNLNEFKLHCGFKEFEVDLPVEMFQGLSNLEGLALESCIFNNLSARHFEDMTSLRVLNLSYVLFDDFDWLRYVILQLPLKFE